MASGGFEVTFEDLEEAAAAYQQQAANIAAALEAYDKPASLDRGDFGRIPEAGQMWTQYQEFLKQVRGDVNEVHNQLNQGGAKLLLSAKVYRTTEQANAEMAAGIGSSSVDLQ
jgi:uncharacterized protein YukE